MEHSVSDMQNKTTLDTRGAEATPGSPWRAIGQPPMHAVPTHGRSWNGHSYATSPRVLRLATMKPAVSGSAVMLVRVWIMRPRFALWTRHGHSYGDGDGSMPSLVVGADGVPRMQSSTCKERTIYAQLGQDHALMVVP